MRGNVADEYHVELEDVSKRFGGVQALAKVSFGVRPGTIHAVVGENGAGKSTVINLLAGVVERDGGVIRFDGTEVDIGHPAAAHNLGIRVVYQEFNLFMDLTVAANIFVADELSSSGLLNEQAMVEKARELLRSFGAEVDPRARISSLSVSQQQFVEIARALSQEAALIVLDEPNSALSEDETETLFDILRSLKARGVTIVLVSHRLEEVFSIADSITVLRDGRHIGTVEAENSSVREVVGMIVGRSLLMTRSGESAAEKNDIALEVRDLTIRNSVSEASFTVARSEVLGFAGLEGSGVADIFLSLFGLAHIDSGTVWIDGKETRIRSPQQAIANSVAYIPANRRTEGLFLNLSIEANLTSVVLKNLSGRGLISRRQVQQLVARLIEELDIRPRDPSTQVNNLSGGNQQKVAVAKWLATEPEILLLNDPTRGVDIGAKEEIHAIVRRLAGDGKGIVVTSSEFEEVAVLADRALIVYGGRIVGELRGDQLTKEAITHAATTGDIPLAAPA